MPKVSVWTARLSVGRAPFQDGRTDGQTAGCLQCWHRSNTAPPSAAQGRRSGAPDSLRAGLADPPEDWPAASPCDAAAVIAREPKSRDFGPSSLFSKRRKPAGVQDVT